MKYYINKPVLKFVSMSWLALFAMISNPSFSNPTATPPGSGLVFSIDEPLIQESTAVSDVLNTYNFETVSNWDKVFRDEYPEYNTAVWEGVGTYEGTGSQVDTPNKYGAAAGVGKYLFIKSTVHSTEDNPGVTLTFERPVAYFGFWWSAGDYQNKLEITLTDGSVVNVETEQVWSSEGFVNEIASNNGHMGSPTAPFLDQNSGEPYAYLNLTSKDDNSKIVSIRFHGRNFETDNHTVTTELIDPPGTIIPSAPNFGHAGRFNVQEVNEVKSTAAAEAAAAAAAIGGIEP